MIYYIIYMYFFWPFSQQIEEKVKQWDLFDLSSDEWRESYRTNEYKWLIKLLKIGVYLITFCLVLGCAVVSKSSLLLITSLINKENSFYFYGNLSVFFESTYKFISNFIINFIFVVSVYFIVYVYVFLRIFFYVISDKVDTIFFC